MNKQQIELVGRVVVKPKKQKSKGDKIYSKIRVAVNRKRKDQTKKEEQEVTYYDLLVFGVRAEKSEKLDKGNLIRAVGDLEVKPYLTKKGDPKVDLTVFSRELQVFDTEVFR
ncbi:single-stranded DNA-binding protein [Candidatus Dojkabacteria bacterium]|nr:single-stranded DNA-binding protein [Candidatus Dojkabacteria bacterium]